MSWFKNPDMRGELHAIFKAAVAAAHPDKAVSKYLPQPRAGRIFLLGGGKAGAAMVAEAERFYRDDCAVLEDRITGLAITRHGYGAPTRAIRVLEAGHPVPDAAGIEATRELLTLAQSADEHDLVVILLSGGGSANWVAPGKGLSLDEKQQITRALLKSGATISEINIVRKHLSRIKGGRLARVIAPAKLVTLAISDVPGDDPSMIASGPTVADQSTTAQAKAIVSKYNILLPTAARALLDDQNNETPKAGDPAFLNSEFHIIARPSDAIAAASAEALRQGYEPIVLGADIEGEARMVAQHHAQMAIELHHAKRKVALISGGELTVTVKGQGRGGPNQEYALALAIALNGAKGIAALSGDTDGTDGGTGSADDPAGALIDATTMARASRLGLDAGAYLADNDSTAFFASLDDLLTPGPTLTNVNDCRVILVRP
jgi:glycerate 2-kinase